MINKLIKILNCKTELNGWLINDKKISSYELFFITNNLDMNRTKEVQKTKVTIYKDFEIDGKKYKGSASTIINPSSKQLNEKIDQLIISASYVKNDYYELVKPTSEKLPNMHSDYDNEEIIEFIPKIIESIFVEDNCDNGKINSAELFLEQIHTKTINSKGVNETYTSYKGQIELVVDWKETNEEVEVTEILNFSDFNQKNIRSFIKETLTGAKLRATSNPMPKIENVPIILIKDSVKEFFSYYLDRASAQLVYQKYSDATIGQDIHRENISSDLLTMTLVPNILGSTESRYIDEDGIKLKEVTLYKDGILKNFHGSNRYSQYLDINPTGSIGNVVIDGGKKTLGELKSEPYLELIYFLIFK